MQLTRYSDYSLRVLMYLAIRTEYLATIEEISLAYGISRAHLMKVVHQLGRAGFLETVRGRGGGIQLARAPEEISVGDVLRHTDRMELAECFEPGANHCQIEPACGLKEALAEALDAFLAVVDRYTVADLIARRRKPLALLLDR